MSVAGWDYEEITGFKERPRESKYVNVNSYGVRANSPEDAKNFSPNGKIWVFGGSTTWGYGVADHQTIPSYLERYLKKGTVNFGRGYYYSLQENLLLATLLRSGYKPDQVVFIDGINERCRIEVYEDDFSALFKKAQNPYPQYSISEIFEPTYQIIRKFFKTITDSNPGKLHKIQCENYGKSYQLKSVLIANMEERDSLCKRFNIKCTTFVQPFAGIDIKANGLGVEAIEQMRLKKEQLSTTWRKMHSVFIDDPLPGDEMTYLVDDVHYSDAANSLIAKRIASQLENRKQ